MTAWAFWICFIIIWVLVYPSTDKNYRRNSTIERGRTREQRRHKPPKRRSPQYEKDQVYIELLERHGGEEGLAREYRERRQRYNQVRNRRINPADLDIGPFDDEEPF